LNATEVKVADTGFVESTAGASHNGHSGIYRRDVTIEQPAITYQLSDLFCLDAEYHPYPVPVYPGGTVSGFYRMQLWLGRLTGRLPRYSVVESGDRAVVDIRREFGEAAVARYRFVALVDDQNLYLEMRLDKIKAAGDIRLTFNLYPDFAAPHDRWLATPTRDLVHQKAPVVLEPVEDWFYCYDKSKPVGGSALLFDPEEVGKVEVRTAGNYGFHVTMDFPDDAETMRLCLRNFAKGTDDAHAVDEFRDKGAGFLSRLRSDIFTVATEPEETLGRSGLSLSQILARHRGRLVEEDFARHANVCQPATPYPLLTLSKREPLRLEMERGQTTGTYQVLALDDGSTVVKLGPDGVIRFDMESREPCYWQVALRHGDLAIRNEFPRLQCMLDTQIIGLAEKDYPASGSYTSFGQSVGLETIGTVKIDKGKHTLWVKACYTPVEAIDYLELVPLNNEVEKPILTFAVIADVHIQDRKENQRNLIRTLRDINQHIRPDLLLDVGDYGGGGWSDRDAMLQYKTIMDEHAGVPYYPVQGNHDIGNDPRAWCSVFGRKSTQYSFDHKGAHFVAFGVDWPVLWAGTASSDALAWLDRDLAAHKHMRTFVFLHPNLVGFPADPLVLPRGGCTSTCSNAPEVLEVLDQHPNVVAVFSGHIHKNCLLVRGDVLHASTSSLNANYPLTYKVVRVYPDRLELRGHQVSDEDLLRRRFIKGGFMGIRLEKPELQEALRNNARGVIRNSGQVGRNHELNRDFSFQPK